MVYCRLLHRHGVTHHKIVTLANSAVRTSDTKHCEHIHSKVAVYRYVVSSAIYTYQLNTKQQIHHQQRILDFCGFQFVGGFTNCGIWLNA